MSAPKKIVIVGGHGKISLRLAHLLNKEPGKYSVTSTIRNPDHASDIEAAGATPIQISLEDDPLSEFVKAFRGADLVYFSAGAGIGSDERTKKVDYEGALKVFDAIEATSGTKPRLVLVSAVDIRNPDIIPDYYTEEDKAISERVRSRISAYMRWKYEADKDLVARTNFKWTILRAGGLKNDTGTGKADIGKTHITQTVSRDDVALALALLAEREDAAGLAIDIVGGETPVEQGLDTAIKNKVTAWIG